MRPASTDLLEPAELVRAAGRLTELNFIQEYGHTHWLAVHVPLGEDALVVALDVGFGSRAGSRPKHLEFHTTIASTAELKAMVEARTSRKEPNVSDMVQVLGRRVWFCPLSKREDAQGALGDRVSIGRAMNKDIVLRHGSISKFHAYFEATEGGGWTVTDAGSKNGTSVGEQRLNAREPRPVANGDRVRFGSIETLFLDARAIWRVLR